MKLVIEGPDLSGKSTIGKRLSYQMGIDIYHHGGPPRDYDDCIKRIDSYPDNMILDRHFCISEQVYGNLGDRVSPFDTALLDLWIIHNKPFVVFCNPGFGYLQSKLQFLLEKPHKSQNHVNDVKKNYRMIYERYIDVIQKINKFTKVVVVDFRNFNIESTIQLIKEYEEEKAIEYRSHK